MSELFNAEAVTDLGGYDGSYRAWPAGWVLGIIESAERKMCKDGVSEGLSLKGKVTEGQGAEGRTWFLFLNLWNKGAKADITCEVASKQMAALCYAIKLLKPEHPSDLVNKVLGIRTKVDTSNNPDGENKPNAFCTVEEYYKKQQGGQIPAPAHISQAAAGMPGAAHGPMSAAAGPMSSQATPFDG